MLLFQVSWNQHDFSVFSVQYIGAFMINLLITFCLWSNFLSLDITLWEAGWRFSAQEQDFMWQVRMGYLCIILKPIWGFKANLWQYWFITLILLYTNCCLPLTFLVSTSIRSQKPGLSKKNGVYSRSYLKVAISNSVSLDTPIMAGRYLTRLIIPYVRTLSMPDEINLRLL